METSLEGACQFRKNEIRRFLSGKFDRIRTNKLHGGSIHNTSMRGGGAWLLVFKSLCDFPQEGEDTDCLFKSRKRAKRSAEWKDAETPG